MKKGNINVSVENIFPLIKKFLYSDHEIFLRELISNATDATIKLKHIASIGKEKIDVGTPMIEVKVDKKAKKLHIIDQGIGMTSQEIEKYINEVAFSGAEEFLDGFGGAPIKSPFQDGHYIYTVIAGSGSGTSSIAPIIYVADLESPRSFNKNLQP